MSTLLTVGQRRDFHGRIDLILDGMNVPADAYQAFHGGGRTLEFGDRFRALVQEFILDPTNPFASEKVKPDASWNYSADGLLTPAEQAANVHDKLGLTGNYEARLVEYPVDGRADGVIVIPFLRDLGTAFCIPDPTGDGYGKVGETVWQKVSAAHKGKAYNYREGQLGSNYVRLNADVRARLEVLEAKVPAEEGVVHYHAIPVNTGNLLAGYSPRNARVSALQGGMLPLGFVQVLCIMLAWPERLSKYNVRWIDCPADEYNWKADGSWAYCPIVHFGDGRLGLVALGAGVADGYYGSAVAFPGVPGDSDLGDLG